MWKSLQYQEIWIQSNGGLQAAHHMVDELKEHAVIGDEIQY